MTKIYTLTLFAVATLLFNNLLHAQMTTDRPDQTESAGTVGKGNLQIETGAMLQYFGEDDDIRHFLAPTSLFRYGIANGIELRITNQFESTKIDKKVTQGFSDMELGAKFELFESSNGGTAIGFLSHVSLPNGSNRISQGSYSVISTLAVAHSLSDKLGLAYNLAYSYAENRVNDAGFSMVMGVAVNNEVSFYIEPYGGYADMSELEVNFNTGLTYLILDNLQLDFSFGTGITDKMNFISAGFSWLVLSSD